MEAVKKYSPDDIIIKKDRQESGLIRQDNTRASKDIYIDFHTVNIYKFLLECQYGIGGFSGAVDNGAKSYIVPNKTEPDFPTRVKRAVFINYYNKYLRAKYKEVFSLQTIKTSVLIGTETQEEHNYLKFCANITGGGDTKEQLNKIMLNASYRDAVAFIIGDMAEGDDLPFCYIKLAGEVYCDADGNPMYTTDRKGNLESIVFVEPATSTENGTRLWRRYWGIDWRYREYSDDNGYSWTRTEEVENTLMFEGKPFLPVKAMFSQDRDDNKNYLPTPESYSIAKLGLGIYDRGSVMDYVIDKQGHSIYVINGKITAMPNGLYNALVYEDGENKLNPPGILSPDYHLPDVHAKRIKELVTEMLDMMDDGGVTAASKNISQESGFSKAFSFSEK